MKAKYTFMLVMVAALLMFAVLSACEVNDQDNTAENVEDDDSSDDDDASSRGVDDGYPLVDTDQKACYSSNGEITCGSGLYGQDAQYNGNQPAYQDNGDGTITDLITGLMWQQNPGDKMDWNSAIAGVDSFSLAGYDDWRVPTIKELYSLILFSGTDISNGEGAAIPFIEDSFFDFYYGDEDAGDRIIDSQWVTSSVYTGKVFGDQECFFGVNFADGRIKCYPTAQGKGYYSIYVRNTGDYGKNSFQDNQDGTVTDEATGLVWEQADSSEGMDWEDALDHCETLALAGQDDWRLPNAKELQSIIDYSRGPDETGTAAIDPVFDVTLIENEAGQDDYPCFWSSTTHVKSSGATDHGVYVAFGRAMGFLNGEWMDVHGAGAQRAEAKEGDPNDFPEGAGPQGDAVRIYNYVRCVRD